MPKTKPKKITKDAAHYQDKPSSLGQRCLGCVMFHAWKCTLVKGKISLEGHCLHWKAK